MPSAKVFFLEFVRKDKVAPGVYSFYFSLQDKPHFLPGQYLQMTLPHKKVDERGTSRYFTIAASPSEKDIMVTTKKGKSSFKKTLFGLTPGTQIQCFGPMGKFVLEI